MKPVEKHTLSSAFKALLRYQLLLPIILASLVTLAIVSYFSGGELQTQQERFNTSISYIIEGFTRHASYELDSIAFSIPNASLEEINTSMQAQWSSHEIFDTLYLLDEHGIIETLVPIDQRYLGLDMSRRKYYLDIDCNLNANISDPFSSLRTGEPTVYVSRCVDGGRLLVGELNLSTLQDATSAGQPRLSQASIFIVASNGTILAHPNFKHVTMQDNISNWEIVEIGLRSKHTTLYYWRDGNFWFGTVETINPMGWLVITEVPFSVVYGPYLGATGAMVFLLIFIFSIAAQRFSTKVQQQVVIPLTNLSASTDALASGDYEVSETLSRNTYVLAEIERLVTNFQNMSQSISSRETLLRESEKQYRRLVENSPDAILVHHEGIIVYANEAATRLYKADDLSPIVGDSLLDFVHPDSKAMANTRLKQIHKAEDTTILPLAEQKHIKSNGISFAAETTTSSIFFDGKYEAQTIVRDISHRKDEELRLKHLASHDFLTDLPNRFFFEDVLQHALAKSKRSREIGAILYLDIDGFKGINDAHGHAVGDIVLKAVAQKIQSSLREGDIVARLGGDEFVILLETLKDKKDASQVASNLLNACAEPVITSGEEIYISLSIGISVFPQDGQNAQLLLQTADAAMYGAKTDGKHRYKYYSSEMRSQTI